MRCIASRPKPQPNAFAPARNAPRGAGLFLLPALIDLRSAHMQDAARQLEAIHQAEQTLFE